MARTQNRGEEVGDGTIKAADLGLSDASTKGTPVDADSVIIVDSADGLVKRSLFSVLTTFFSAVFAAKVTPGTSGNVMTSNGSAWVSSAPSIADNAVSYAKQGSEFKDDLTITGNAIDWATGWYKEITLTSNTTFTFTNLEKGKVIHLKMTGAYVPTFPSGCIIINGGTYTGAKQNNIYIECVNSTTPQFKIAIHTEP